MSNTDIDSWSTSWASEGVTLTEECLHPSPALVTHNGCVGKARNGFEPLRFGVYCYCSKTYPVLNDTYTQQTCDSRRSASKWKEVPSTRHALFFSPVIAWPGCVSSQSPSIMQNIYNQFWWPLRWPPSFLFQFFFNWHLSWDLRGEKKPVCLWLGWGKIFRLEQQVQRHRGEKEFDVLTCMRGKEVYCHGCYGCPSQAHFQDSTQCVGC